MRPHAIRSAAALALAAAVIAPPAAAQSQAERPPPAAESPAQAAREGLDRLLKALEQTIKAFPQYEMPRVTERGDIIIRRVNPAQPAPPRPTPPGEDETRT